MSTIGLLGCSIVCCYTTRERTDTCFTDSGLTMYQAVYPWLVRDQFKLLIPDKQNNSNWSTAEKKMVTVMRRERPEHVEFTESGRHCDIVTKYVDDDGVTCGPTLQSASQKLLSFITRRDVHVVYHGPDTCGDRKPWCKYEHFHLTFISKVRPGLDTVWANAVHQHKAVSKSCHIPNTQVTKFPGSWANYLTQLPRLTWRVPICQLMHSFSMWIFEPYVVRDTPTEAAPVASTSRQSPNDFQLPSGRTMNLYKYIRWLIKEYDYEDQVAMTKGAMLTHDHSTFEKALTHPMFNSVCAKAFSVDKAMEIIQGFQARYESIDWAKYEQNEKYFPVDVSLNLFRHLLTHHDISVDAFVQDVWDILTFKRPKTNLMFLHGVPNSGKSYIVRSFCVLFKFLATVQGSSSFPFMELASASCGLIEEPSFTDEALQSFKKLAEGTPTEVSVKNKGAVKISRIPLFLTANYPFWKDGGALERQAFSTRMIEYQFKQSAGFLKLAKKQLNPAMWKQLFAPFVYPRSSDDSGTSGDDELLEYLALVTPPSKKSRLNVPEAEEDTLTMEDVVLAEIHDEVDEDFDT